MLPIAAPLAQYFGLSGEACDRPASRPSFVDAGCTWCRTCTCTDPLAICRKENMSSDAPSSAAAPDAEAPVVGTISAERAVPASNDDQGTKAAAARASEAAIPASPGHDDDYHEDDGGGDQAAEILSRLFHRTVTPTDLRPCYTIESESYPPDEAASLESLQYRQHHAAPYFRCAALLSADGAASVAATAAAAAKQKNSQKSDPTAATDSMKMSGEIVGFVTGTRCSAFDVASMTVHDPRGSMLAIHSVVVSEQYRRMGIGSAMLREYVASIRKMTVQTPIDKIVLIAKADKLAFYVRAGFTVVGVSPIVHGRDTWYECSCDLTGGSGLAGIVDLAPPAASVRVDGASCADPSGGHYSLGPLGSAATGGAAAADDRLSNAGDDSSTAAIKAGGGPWSSLASKMACGKSCFIVDSFADPSQPGSGNPAAVVYMGDAASVESVGEREEAWMRTVAMEFSLSETAFLWQRRRGDGASSALWSGDEVGYDIRYYTKGGNEVKLCGHATLAAASVVLRVAAEDASRPTAVKGAVFYAKEDVLKASIVEGSGDDTSSTNSNSETTNTRIVMDFPWRSVGEVDDPAEKNAAISMLQSAFGLADGSDEADDLEKSDILYIGLDSVGEDLLVELTPDAFDRVGPAESSLLNIAALKSSEVKYSRGVILCCRVSKDGKDGGARGRIDFLSRFFGPKAGIDEDPVTGSAHCTLGPYFGAKIGRSRVVGRQASSRGGIVECVLMDGGGEGEGRPRRVSITGTAVTTVCGSLLI